MVGHNGNVSGVRSCPRRKRNTSDQPCGQFGDLRRDVKQREVGQQCNPSLSYFWISRPRFVEHDLRKVQVELRSPLLPPRVRQLLAGRHNEIAAGPACQVAEMLVST